jgi:hypothetical protein
MANNQKEITQGVLESSYRNTHAVILKRANEKTQKNAVEYLNTHCQDLVVAQRLTPDKAEKPLTYGKFYLTSYQGKCEPGFIVFLPNQPPIFVRFHLSKREREQTRGGPICYIMRLRVSSIVNEGSVFVAALDPNSHLMILEDIYVWRNENIFNKQTFSKRRELMKEFAEIHWIPDARLLGGIITEISQPKPLSSFQTLIENKESHRIDFVPESAMKRRFYILVNETQGQLSSSDGYYGRATKEKIVLPKIEEPKIEEPKIEEPKIEEPKIEEPKIEAKAAKAVKVPLLPDVYDLFDSNNNNLGRAAIQQLELSKKLKEVKGDIYVSIHHNTEFNRYEILSLLKPNIL